MRKLFVFFLACVLVLSMSVPAFAAEADGFLTNEVNSATMSNGACAATIPDKYTTSYPYTAMINQLDEDQGTYTKYYFSAPNGWLKAEYNLSPDGSTANVGRKFTIEIYVVGTNKKVDSTTISFSSTTSGTVTFSGLSTTSYYYFRFVNSSAVNLFRTKTITGTVDITNA